MAQTNGELIAMLIRRGRICTPAVREAFERVDRGLFIGGGDCYGDFPLSLGCGQTISQPTTVAMMLEWLQVRPGDRVLDIGSGSGWTTALLAQLTGERGEVLGLERIGELVAEGRKNLGQFPFPWARIEEAGRELGRPGDIFDRILVSAAADRFPLPLLDQLTPDGIAVVPVGSSVVVVHNGTPPVVTEYPGFRFVPLL